MYTMIKRVLHREGTLTAPLIISSLRLDSGEQAPRVARQTSRPHTQDIAYFENSGGLSKETK